MINLKPIISRITALLDEDTEASVTYAALEARLALEKVCYDRLRQRHDYISHAQLKRWQPGAVVSTLMTEVDPHVAGGGTLSISTAPMTPGVDHGDYEYVEVGTEVGFDAKRIAKLWQALANLALHVRLPEHKEDYIPDYGDKVRTSSKVQEVVAELERLSKSTMSFSCIPLGGETTFECICGEANRRRAGLLRDGQHVLCINPTCKATWRVEKSGDDIYFTAVMITVNCSECGEPNDIPRRYFEEMRPDQHGAFLCKLCRHRNLVQWRLMQVKPIKPDGES